MMRTSLITLILLLFLASCSKKEELLVGNTLPVTGINKNLPKFIPSYPLSTQALTVEYQKHLDTLLENELVVADELKLYQNRESHAPLLEMIDHAEKYFYMNVLSFSCDETTESIVQRLENKVKNGVDVRLIVNRGFSYLSLGCLKRLKEMGVKIVKMKTHSSYFLNDQQELLIGSQNIARMFFLADGFNSLDRDMMIYAKGALATDAFKDFISIWAEDSDERSKDFYESDFLTYKKLLKIDYLGKKRGEKIYVDKLINPERSCRFIAERPKLGRRDIQEFWQDMVKSTKHELLFSGVKVETGDGVLGKSIREKAKSGADIRYLGNGYLGGNGELSMVMEEWIDALSRKHLSLFSYVLRKINDWDKRRLAIENKKLYDSLQGDSPVKVWTYFNFLHYKIWLFDHPAFFIGSANLDESKFGIVYDSGIFCLDSKISEELSSNVLRDQNNSVLYEAKKWESK